MNRKFSQNASIEEAEEVLEGNYENYKNKELNEITNTELYDLQRTR